MSDRSSSDSAPDRTDPTLAVIEGPGDSAASPEISVTPADRLVPIAPTRRARTQPFILASLVLAAALLVTLLLWRGDRAPPEDARNTTARGELLEIEERLESLAFPPGVIDGVADAATEAAIRDFQRAAGLPEDGRATPLLLDELRALAGEN